jgi:TatD DNase family protein
MNFIDTHTHIDGEEFRADLDATIQRAKEAGATKLFVPAIDMASLQSVGEVCARYPGYCYGMMGLHPEEVREDYDAVLDAMEQHITDGCWIGIGEVGLDYYWSREYEKQQLAAFERQVEWSVATRLPLMIHCRKAQNEMVRLLRQYAKELPGGVFHCFTGNEHEAEELLEFGNFGLGIGGVLTFRKSNLPATLAATVPLNRVVLETDAPYMTPVPHRGERNESAYIVHIIEKMAEVYGLPAEEIARQTTENAQRYFPKAFAQ